MSKPKIREARVSDAKTTRRLRAVTLVGIYGGLLVPLVFLPGLVFYPFIFPKLLFLQILISLTLPAFLVLAWREPRYRPRFSWVYAALGGHCVALALSAAMAMDRHRALWGNQERMNGLISLLHFVAWFSMASSVLKTWPDWRKLLHWQAGLGVAMAIVALLQRPFPSLLGSESDARVSGLLGNPIYLGAYEVFTVFWLALLWSRAEKPVWRRYYAAGIAVCAGAAWVSGSRGPLLGLIAGAVTAFGIWAIGARRYRLVALEGGALACLAAGYSLVARHLVPMPSLEGFWSRNGALRHIFQADVDPARRLLWEIAWRAFQDRKWLGWGWANYDIAFDTHFDPRFMCWGPGGSLQDSSHSLYLDHLSTTGIVGFVTFLLLWASAFAAIRSAQRAKRLALPAFAVLAGMLAFYLVQGAFVFDSPGVLTMTHLLLALAVAVAGPEWDVPKKAEPARGAHPTAARRISTPLFLGLEIAGALLAFRTSFLPAYASFTAGQAHVAFRRGDCRGALALASEAAQIPTPYLEDQLLTLSLNLASLSESGTLDRCPEWRSVLDRARALMGDLLEWRPVRCRYRWTWASLLTTVGTASRDPAILAEAGRELETNLAENPRRQQLQYAYAHWLASVGRRGEAMAHLDLALSQDERIGDSLWRKGVFLWRDFGQARAGAELMAKAMEGECRHGLKSAVEVAQLAKAYSILGDGVHLKDLVRNVQDFSKGDRPTLVHLVVARCLDMLGLAAERDRVLEIAQQRDKTLGERLSSWRAGRVPLGDIERFYGGAPSPTPRALASAPQDEPRDPSSTEAQDSRRLASEAAVP